MNDPQELVGEFPPPEGTPLQPNTLVSEGGDPPAGGWEGDSSMSASNQPGMWLAPLAVLLAMANQVGDNDACNECSYPFNYTLEGCDACRPITQVLEAVDRGTDIDH